MFTHYLRKSTRYGYSYGYSLHPVMVLFCLIDSRDYVVQDVYGARFVAAAEMLEPKD